LEKLQIDVAGADSVRIWQNLVWLDLLAFVRFLSFPMDDYNIACLLKSPFISGVTEELLFSLCFKRNDPLFYSDFVKNSDLNSYYNEANKNSDTSEFLDFFYRVLANVHNSFYAEYGEIANLAFEAFFNQAALFFKQNPPNLRNLLTFLEAARPIVKDAGAAKVGVQFMTVHSSKGRQAPVVFIINLLGDRVILKEKLVWIAADNEENKKTLFDNGSEKLEELCDTRFPVPTPPEHPATKEIKAIRDQAKEQLFEESRRLLYVAMTRAQDGLCCIGIREKDNWQDTIASSVSSEFFGSYETTRSTAECKEQHSNIAAITRPQIQFSKKVLKPCKSADESNLGILIHFLIERCCEENFDESAAQLVLSQKAKLLNISDEIIKQIDIPKVLNICKFPEFSWIRNGKHEVSMWANGKMFRADHLYIDENQAVVIEVKTSKNAVNSIDEINTEYIEQLTNYRSLVKQIFPNKTVKAYFLWVQNQKFIELPI
jgi:ATP-dependent helicase/nuclease subunit A